MGSKGDRARLEPIARQRYIETGNLTQVAEELDISRQTLTKWKGDTRRNSDEFDEWDRAREEKRSRIDRLRTMFDEQLTYAENLEPEKRNSKLMDTLSKLGALIERWEKIEDRAREEAMASGVANVEAAAKERGTSDEELEFWVNSFLKAG